MLTSAYLNARVVALPSAFETPGLVALEAASLGRTVVVTNVGSAPEYFKNHAYYVNPESQRSITSALQTAWDKPFDEKDLSRFVLQNYTWKKAAEQTSKIYHELLT
jgi:glycosyltransferase involved in cell wall biosynthesis